MPASSSFDVRVLIVDCVAARRKHMARLLVSAPEIEVVGMARNGSEAAGLARELRPEVIVIDPDLTDMDGLDAIRQILQQVPTAQVILVSVTSDAAYLERARQAGVKSVLPQPPKSERLVDAIRASRR